MYTISILSKYTPIWQQSIWNCINSYVKAIDQHIAEAIAINNLFDSIYTECYENALETLFAFFCSIVIFACQIVIIAFSPCVFHSLSALGKSVFVHRWIA